MGFPELAELTDRAVLAHLGGTVQYQPQFGVAVNVSGIFDAAYLLAGTGTAGGPGVETARPAVFFLLSDLPTDPDQDDPLITVDGVVYRVRERQKDGKGGVVLVLREA